jgi:hypothetical protein
MGKSITIAGSIAQRPSRGGHTWVFLQYLLGFRRLGYDVLLLDALDSECCVDEQGRACSFEDSWNVRYLKRAMKDFQLQDSFAILCDGGAHGIGIPKKEVVNRVAQAECLINVMGFLADEDVLAAASKRIFLDIDPGFGQMWRELHLADIFAGHDAYVTVGANVGRQDCLVPTCGIDWIATVPPVVLDHWPACAAHNDAKFTSVVSWRGPFGPIEYQGRTYGLRVHEFRKFIELPPRSGKKFELALDIDPVETKDLALLKQNDWNLVDPGVVARSPQDYQSYIQNSKAELGVAKNMYVHTRGGWISDRTVCYLASGKPALVQDTGIRDIYPTGEGLLVFSDMDEALDGVERICSDYQRHAKAAREIAEQFFDSDKVLRQLLTKLGVD